MVTRRQKLLLFGGPQYVTLPQNLLLSPGTLWEDFENAADWTIAGGTAVADTTNFKTATQSLKLTSNAGANVTAIKTINWDLSGNWKQLRFWVYLYNATLTNYSNFAIEFSNDAARANRYWCWNNGTNPQLVAGWNLITWPKGYFKVGAGAPTWANPMVRLRFTIQANAGQIAVASFDDLEIGQTCVPAVILRFDDGYDTAYSVAYAYMNPYRIRGSECCITNKPGTGGVYGTWAQLQEMNAANWSIANHTRTHTDLTTLNEAQQEAEIIGGHDDLIANGLPNGSHYVAYPGGTYNANTITAMTNLAMLIGWNARVTHGQDATPYSPTVLPNYVPFQTGTNPTSDTTTVARCQAWIDEAIAGGLVTCMLWHNIGVGANMTAANFRLVIDYIRTKALAGLIYPITIDDLYKLTLGPVSVPKIK